MKTVACTVWGDWISPVFESSSQLCILQVEKGRISRQKTMSMCPLSWAGRIEMLLQHKADILVCGAISNVYSRMIEAQDIEVIAFVCGHYLDVIEAYLQKTIRTSCSMPGCGKRRRRRRRGGNQ